MFDISKMICLAILFCLLNGSLAKDLDESLFMSREDSIKALSMIKKSQNIPLNVSGIFFIDDMNWTVWVNGKSYSSTGQKENFSLDEVSETSVTITTLDGNTVNLPVN